MNLVHSCNHFEMVIMTTIIISVFGHLHFDEENACRKLVFGTSLRFILT